MTSYKLQVTRDEERVPFRRDNRFGGNSDFPASGIESVSFGASDISYRLTGIKLMESRFSIITQSLHCWQI